tara:strand:+ start:436 stop:741 length:306 start_codon:yes stop_codon:yes gene_type:complete
MVTFYFYSFKKGDERMRMETEKAEEKKVELKLSRDDVGKVLQALEWTYRDIKKTAWELDDCKPRTHNIKTSHFDDLKEKLLLRAGEFYIVRDKIQKQERRL